MVCQEGPGAGARWKLPPGSWGLSFTRYQGHGHDTAHTLCFALLDHATQRFFNQDEVCSSEKGQKNP
eukprot:2689435-Rhodomonas_salina.6